MSKLKAQYPLNLEQDLHKNESLHSRDMIFTVYNQLLFPSTPKTSNLRLEVSFIMTAELRKRHAGLLPVVKQLLTETYAAERNYHCIS
jgi:hypothetical protein